MLYRSDLTILMWLNGHLRLRWPRLLLELILLSSWLRELLLYGLSRLKILRRLLLHWLLVLGLLIWLRLAICLLDGLEWLGRFLGGLDLLVLHLLLRELLLLWRLIALCIETGVNNRLRVAELLDSALQWCMRCLLPCRDVLRGRRDIDAWHGIGVRRHIGGHTLAGQ